MSEKPKKRSLLPNLELLILIVFFFSFLMFAIPKCNQTKMEYDSVAREKEEEELENLEADLSFQKKEAVDSTTLLNDSLAAQSVGNGVPATTAIPAASNIPSIPPAPTTASYATKLYITIDQLNMRKGPSLDSVIVTKLPLFEEVFFLNEITNFTQKISLGPEMADEPWVKIETKEGKQGWVYGAGVYYYKRKRLPDLETEK